MRRIGKMAMLALMGLSLYAGVTDNFFIQFGAVVVLMASTMIFIDQFPEMFTGWYWKGKWDSLKFWKPRTYPDNINDIVAEEYRRRLFRKK